MNVFLWEALSAGVMGADEPSLLREGRAMLSALAADVLATEDCRVATIVDKRVEALPIENDRFQVQIVGDQKAELAAFHLCASTCDRTWLIAPEIDGLLWKRIEFAKSVGGQVIGPTSAAARLCGDKLALADHFAACGLAGIETQSVDDSIPRFRSTNDPFPCVIKPRYGAGSLNCRRIDSADQWRQWIETSGTSNFIVQPFVAGETLSVSAIIQRNVVTVFPLGRQILSDDGRFEYRGGTVGGGHRCQSAAEDLVQTICRSIEGLAGYVGFDLIAPSDRRLSLRERAYGSAKQTRQTPRGAKADGRPDVVLVEINPRLTTSYLGYRRLTEVNLAERVLFPEIADPIRWNPETVQFSPLEFKLMDGEGVSGEW